MRLYGLLLGSDLLALILGILLPMPLRQSTANWTAILVVTLPIFAANAFNANSYSIRALQTPLFGISGALRSLVFTYATLFLISYFFRAEQRASRLILIAAVVIAAVLIVAFRQLIASIIRSRFRHALTADLMILDRATIPVPASMTAIDAAHHRLAPDLRDPAMLNRLAGLLSGWDRVVVACPPEARRAWAMLLKGADVRGEIVVDDANALGAIGVARVDQYMTLAVSVGPLSLRNRLMKRAFDLALCLPALVALAPVLLLTALAVKLDSRGPIFFRQQRVGRGNAFFSIVKFRSMHVELCDADGNVSAMRDDDRLTRVGRLIRRTSIDELPQLLNVLAGSMSMVGPRPHALGSLAGEHLFWEVDERYWHRHTLKPGITGLAQVRGFRGATHHRDDLVRRLQADLEYAANWSLWRDLSILFATFKVIIHKNTY